MNAKEARQLTVQTNNKLLSDKEVEWLKLNKYIIEQIEIASLSGKFEVILNMKDLDFSKVLINDFSFIKNKLEVDEFEVSYILERSPNGKRKLVISW